MDTGVGLTVLAESMSLSGELNRKCVGSALSVHFNSQFIHCAFAIVTVQVICDF